MVFLESIVTSSVIPKMATSKFSHLGTNVSSFFTGDTEKIQFQERFNDASKGIGRFWRFGSICFVTSANNRELESFQALPFSFSYESSRTSSMNVDEVPCHLNGGGKHKGTSRASVGRLLLRNLSSPVLEIFNVEQQSPSQAVLVVCHDGSVLACWLDVSKYCWLHNYVINLSTAAPEHRSQLGSSKHCNRVSADSVASVALHWGHGAIYWCEFDPNSQLRPRMYKAFKSRINFRYTDTLAVTLSDATCLIKGDVPHVHFITLQDYVLMWFTGGHKLDEEMSSYWFPLYLLVAADGTKRVHTFGHSPHLKVVDGAAASDDLICTFAEHFMNTLFHPSLDTERRLGAVHVEEMVGYDLLVLATCNKLIIVSNLRGDFVSQYDLPNCNCENPVYFVVEDIFCIVDTDTVIFRRLKDGCKWKTIDVKITALWRATARSDAAVYVQCDKGMFHWTADDLGRCYEDSSLGHSSMQPEFCMLLKCDEIYHSGLTRTAGLHARLRTECSPPIRSTSALLVALSQKCLEGNMSPLVAATIEQDLKHVQKNENQSTDLNQKVGPLLDSYFLLMESLNEQLGLSK